MSVEAPETPRDDDVERQLPHDPAAEMSVLGAGLLAAETLDYCIAAGLKGSHFFAPRHELIYGAMMAAYEAGRPVDAVLLADHLHRTGDLGRVGGHAYLHSLLSTTPTAANASYYAAIVRDHALRRKVIAAGQRITQIGYMGRDASPADMLAEAEATISGVADGALNRVGATAADGFPDMLERLETGVSTIATPWRDLNALLGGWVAGNLYVFAARPAGGKSISGLQAALDLARRLGKPTVLCSMEMTRDQLLHRIVAQLGPVNLSRLTRGGDALDEDDWRRIVRVHRIMATGGKLPGDAERPVPLDIVDQAGMTLTDIRAAYRASARRHGVPPGLLIVDYLQLMKSSTRAESRQVEVAAFAYGLKEAALDLNVPIVALAQLNRGPAASNRRPIMSDLRESGAIEQAADVVVLQSRQSDDDGRDTDFIDFDVAKNRQGEPGVATLRWEGRHARILDPALDDDGRLAL